MQAPPPTTLRTLDAIFGILGEAPRGAQAGTIQDVLDPPCAALPPCGDMSSIHALLSQADPEHEHPSMRRLLRPDAHGAARLHALHLAAVRTRTV